MCGYCGQSSYAKPAVHSHVALQVDRHDAWYRSKARTSMIVCGHAKSVILTFRCK